MKEYTEDTKDKEKNSNKEIKSVTESKSGSDAPWSCAEAW